MKYSKGNFMKQIISIGLVLTSFAIPLFAQASDTSSFDSQIELPDLTTVVTGGDDTIDYAPPPSFEDVLDMPYDSGDLVPVLPSVSVSDDSELDATGRQATDKDIYAEGKIGGGYPASFTGDFEISRLYGADPFKISFTHESTAGFAGHNLADGFKESRTAILLEKDFIRHDLRWGFSGQYEDIGNGLQSKVEGITANNQDSAIISGDLLWSLPYGFSLGIAVDSRFYFRFADITKASTQGIEIPSSIKNTSRITADPQLDFAWTYNGFKIALDAKYDLEAWTKASNRGQFDLNFSWGNDKINLFAQGGIVIGNYIGNNEVIAPLL